MVSPKPYDALIKTTWSKPDSVSSVNSTPAAPMSLRTMR